MENMIDRCIEHRQNMISSLTNKANTRLSIETVKHVGECPDCKDALKMLRDEWRGFTTDENDQAIDDILKGLQ